MHITGEEKLMYGVMKAIYDSNIYTQAVLPKKKYMILNDKHKSK